MGTSPSGSTLLVLDDDADVRRIVTLALARDGHRILQAADVPHALELLGHEVPDLLIVDLMLPHVDGEDFLREMARRLPRRPPVLLLTASASRKEVARRLGVEASLEKPFDLDELRALTRYLLASSG